MEMTAQTDPPAALTLEGGDIAGRDQAPGGAGASSSLVGELPSTPVRKGQPLAIAGVRGQRLAGGGRLEQV